ncbi:unnamed protein product [Penicillium salamii]|nr:unnamed protein product [Penicillium salamii]CAG8245549.1 unnamed protein product [Penicillium salamii]
MADPEWDDYKTEIERLYIHENKTRDEVVDVMATEHSWKRSRAQYSRKFKEWGLRKQSQPRNDHWISRRVEKRKREANKESEVFVNGVQIHPAKISRSSYRKGFLTEYSRRGPSPSTPEGYVVATPTSPEIHVSWNIPLPWMQFMRLFQPSQGNDHSAPRSVSSPTLNSSQNVIAVSKNTTPVLIEQLSTIIPWSKLQHAPNMHSASRISATLQILMPENEPGEHDAFSKNLSSSTAGVWEQMSLLFYLISNNLILLDRRGDGFVIKRLDAKILQILKDTGWDDFKHLKRLISTRTPTAGSIAEKIFAAAVRRDNFDIVEKMLQAGMNPDECLIEDSFGEIDGSVFTALQHVSATSGSASSINLLITHGADVDFSINADGRTALFYAIEARNGKSIRVLVAHNANVTRECVSSATGITPEVIEDFSLIENIIDIYLDQDAESRPDDKATLLEALSYGNLPILKRYLAKGANLNGLLTTRAPDGNNECQTTLLGLAARDGDVEMVRLLLHVSFHEDPSLLHLPYVPPLVFAARRGSVDICEALLGSNANIQAADEGEKTLLERTIPMGKLALCQLLIDHGAKVNREPREIQRRPSALMLAVQHMRMDIIDLLMDSGARLNDSFDVVPGTVLGAAVEIGDKKMIHKLYNAGARRVGLGIRGFGSLQSAIFIQKKGLLSKMLNHSGPKLLSAAISALDDGLAWFLLQNNAHEEGNKPEPLTKTPLWAAILLAAFTGAAPTAVSAAVLKASMIDLELLRKANVDLRGAPRISGNRLDLGVIKLIPYANSHRPQSVLEIAAWKADEVIFKYIVEWASALQMSWSPDSIAGALVLAIFERKHYHIAELMRLGSDLDGDIAANVPESFCDRDDWERETYSPLQAAVRTQQVSIVCDLLASKRVDVNYLGEGQYRKSPLQHAVKLGNMEIINILLENWADVNAPAADNSGATALQIAAIQGYIGIARMLLDLGADVNQKPAKKDGRTALMGAAEHGRIDMLQMLLDEGAQITGEYECYFREAVELAEGQGHYAAARLLKRFRDRTEFEPFVHWDELE